MSSPGGKPLKEPRSIFQGRFVLTHLLGKGGFGEVYAGVQTSNKELVAVKVEQNNGRASFLFHEARVMKDIQKRRTQDGIAGIATLKYFGQEIDYRVLIMSLQGSSIEDFHERLGRFSLQTTVCLADQMLSRLEYIHGAGYVHRDLKADNFVVGRNSNSRRIFMIDFGLSSRYLTSEGTHREVQVGKAFLGTSRFASLRTHQGISQSRRDDMEQLVYLMIYMYRGRLPWSGLNIKEHDVKQRKIGEIKAEMSPAQICAKCPRQYEDLLYYTRHMDFAEDPQYEMCRVLIRSVLDEENPPQKLDYVFDWEKPRNSDSLRTAPSKIINQDIQFLGSNGNEDRKGMGKNGEDGNVITSTAKANGVLSDGAVSPREIVSIDER